MQETGETMRLANRTALITGAAGTIGQAAARRLQAEGARLVLVDREAPVSPGSATTVLSVAADVTQEPDMIRVAAQAKERFGTLDIVFANAGIAGPVAPLVDLAVVDFDRVMAVNVRGVFLTMKHLAPAMRDGGSIIATSSVAGLRGAASLAAYAASKHAVMGLVATAAAELAPRGIRVNAVNPGPVEGPMMRGLEEGRAPGSPERAHEAIRARMRLGRYVDAAEVAALVLFLASDDSRAITGRSHVIDCGLLL